MTWMIAMTMPNREGRVVSELRENGFDAVFPRIRKLEIVGGARRRWRGRERTMIVEHPVLPNYVFFTGSHWQRALDVEGVTLVLRRGGDRSTPATLSAELLTCLLNPEGETLSLLGPAGDGLVEDHSQVREIARAFRKFIEGQTVRVKSDLWLEDISEGTVISATAKRVRVKLGLREVNLPVDIVETVS